MQVTPTGGGVFMVADRGPTVGFSPPIRQTEHVYAEANSYCAKLGKEVETVKLDQQDSGLARPAAATLWFKCVPPGTAGASGPSSAPPSAAVDPAAK
jgi:hypothetical protein